MLLVIYYTETFTGIKMNSNQSNNRDGSFHIRLAPVPKIPKEEKKEEKKEVKKNDKKDRK